MALAARNTKEAMVALMVGLAGSEFGGSMEFCVGAYGSNLASVAVKMLSHSTYFIKKSCTFCTFRVTSKDNVQ